MSADNWRECPKCGNNQKSDRQLALDKLVESYGTLPLDQWLEKHKEAVSMPEEWYSEKTSVKTMSSTWKTAIPS